MTAQPIIQISPTLPASAEAEGLMALPAPESAQGASHIPEIDTIERQATMPTGASIIVPGAPIGLTPADHLALNLFTGPAGMARIDPLGTLLESVLGQPDPADPARPAPQTRPPGTDDDHAGDAEGKAVPGDLETLRSLDPPPPPGRSTDLEKAFWLFHGDNPAIYELFTNFMDEVIDRGLDRISADQVMHRIRWERDVVTRGGRGFKVNNNLVAYYARLWLHHNPGHLDMFQTRRVRKGERTQPRREEHRQE